MDSEPLHCGAVYQETAAETFPTRRAERQDAAIPHPWFALTVSRNQDDLVHIMIGQSDISNGAQVEANPTRCS